MSEALHYVGNESFARNLFQDSKDVREAPPMWLTLSPAQRAYWRRQAALLIEEGRQQGPLINFTGHSTVKPGSEPAP